MEQSSCSKEAELELGLGLGLGLSLGGSFEYGRRILTAKDFPSGFKSATKRERSTAVPPPPPPPAAASHVVGWPPVRAYRMNTLFNQAKTSNVEEDNQNLKKKINQGNDKNINVPIKERVHLGFVKVYMDGLPIGRKVDLNAHKSYETLAKALEEMFFKPSLTCGGKEQPVHPPKLLDGSSEFVLTYEDKEGDWMLLGDVPWGMLLETVKRVRIMRTSEANGLAPKLQERNDVE